MTLYLILKVLTELAEARFFGDVELQLENGRIVEIRKSVDLRKPLVRHRSLLSEKLR